MKNYPVMWGLLHKPWEGSLFNNQDWMSYVFFSWLTRVLLPLLIYPLKADASGHASADEFGLCMARGKGCLSTGAGGEGFVRLRRLISTDIPGLWSPAKTNCQAKPVSWILRSGGCTVDGSEIRRSPVDMVNITLFTTGFSTIPGGPGFLSSKVQPFLISGLWELAPFSLQIRGLEKVTSGIPPPGGYIFWRFFFLLAWLLRVYTGWNTTQVMWELVHKLWNTRSRWWFRIHTLFSPRKLGKVPILTSIFFRWVETTNQNKNPVIKQPVFQWNVHHVFFFASSLLSILVPWKNG